ncbi:MAG: histidine kinase [Deltaproteobacteria bacterium]|nr:MAG: histidine kinase [Deltaproteobacteria bacterium]
MRIAIVGAGNKSLYLMDIIDKYKFQIIYPVVVAVADINNDAPGLVEARESGFFVTNDYNDFFKLDNIDLIVELTGDLDIYNDILSKKNNGTRAIAHTTAMIFWEIDHAARRHSKTNQELSETLALYNVLINGLIHEDVVVIGLNHKIIDINDAFLKNLGLTRDEAIGHNCYEITHHHSIPCSGEEHPCPLANVIKTGEPSRATHIHQDQNGNKRHVSISCYPLIEKGVLKGVIEVSKDITKDIEFEKKMMQQEKLVSIGRLSAGVAHEINNPLTTILTSAMLIQEDLEEGTEIHQELAIISNEALRCRKIVKSLLDFARQTKSFKRMDDLNEVIKESLVLTRKQAKFKDVDLSASLAGKLPPLAIDRDKIQQTLINLTLNAIEATPPGGKIRLSTRYFEEKKIIEIKVSDTGDGILPDNLLKIFDPFFTTKKNGTGLGLAITHGIIEQHGGTISVNSTPGKGTDFVVRLPLPQGNDN